MRTASEGGRSRDAEKTSQDPISPENAFVGSVAHWDVLEDRLAQEMRRVEEEQCAAMLKVQCEKSKSSYAMFWERYKYVVS